MVFVNTFNEGLSIEVCFMSTDVRIYRPAKTAMQSGRFNTQDWVLEFEPTAGPQLDPLMGWAGSRDTLQQVQLRFPTKEGAVAFAKHRGLTYRVQEPGDRVVKPKSYAGNFDWRKVR